ncbi:hypothetical protein LZP73_12320 [Shewanella sp. AS16]|uniref:hypothetical protein n=1 Tax=Shewanella sp. AS16 TaxID=2907625 RepID=UPI001F31A20E|nr:hypothetical protein [Shewanella sp. AS16]MCE9686978.1 hypothetical protein [Shewanella sp. AS16]
MAKMFYASAVFRLDLFISLSFLVAVLQALLGNLTDVNAFLLMPVYLSVFIFLFHKQLFLRLTPEVFFYMFSILLFVLVSLFSVFTLKEEFYYQIYFYLCFVSLYLVSSCLYLDSDKFVVFSVVLAIFFLISLAIHIFFWEPVALLFYSKGNEFGGLLLDGNYHRLYSLLLNPLTTAFSSLFILATLMIVGIRNKFLYLLLSLLCFLAFSRTAILCLLLIWSVHLFTKKYYLTLVFVGITLLSFIVSNDQLFEIVSNVFMGTDKTGSADEHFLNLGIGSNFIFSFSGNGYVSATDFGGWNVRLESTPFQLAFTGGFFPFLFSLSVIFFSAYNLYVVKGCRATLIFISVMPVYFFFPLHTFSFGVFAFCLLCNSWRFTIEGLKND